MKKKDVSIAWTLDRVGAGLLETITSGLYLDPKHAIREYCQNSLDSKAKKIEINTEENRITIKDDGTGMDKKDIHKAERIGMSEKKLENIGFRGIGIWSGVAVADKIIIRTKKKGTANMYELVIDAKGIRQKKLQSQSLKDVLNKHVRTFENPAERHTHYTDVILDGIVEEMKDLADPNKLESYIALTLPVSFPDTFKYKNDIEDALETYVDQPIIKIILNGKNIHKAVPKENYEAPKYFPIKNNNGEILGFTWVCVRKKTGGYTEEAFRGLVLKVKGIAIGNPEKTRFAFKGSYQLHPWCWGELHVLYRNAKPDAPRSDLESCKEKEEFGDACIVGLKPLIDYLREKSDRSTADKKIRKIAKEIENFRDSEIDISLLRGEEKIEKIIELRTKRNSLMRRKKKASLKMKKTAEKEIERINEMLPKEKITPVQREIIEKKKKKKTEYCLDDVLSSKKVSKEAKAVLRIVKKVLKENLRVRNYEKISRLIGQRICDKLKLGEF